MVTPQADFAVSVLFLLLDVDGIVGGDGLQPNECVNVDALCAAVRHAARLTDMPTNELDTDAFVAEARRYIIFLFFLETIFALGAAINFGFDFESIFLWLFGLTRLILISVNLRFFFSVAAALGPMVTISVISGKEITHPRPQALMQPTASAMRPAPRRHAALWQNFTLLLRGVY